MAVQNSNYSLDAVRGWSFDWIPLTSDFSINSQKMASPFVIGVGALAAGLVGRQLYRAGFLGGKQAAVEYLKGGFRPKMDRKEAIAILGLKFVQLLRALLLYTDY